MSTIRVRIPDALHEKVRELAVREHVSIDQLITLALTEKVSALTAEDYTRERAERGDNRKFQRAMAKVEDIEPDERDRI